MFKLSILVTTMGILLALQGMAPVAAAQSSDGANLQEIRPLRPPIPPYRAASPVSNDDYHRLEMGPKSGKHRGFRIGRLEIVKRQVPDPPIQPELPYYLRPHVASLDIRLRER